jgi:sulfatase maturation enzyme AslB (radical SAM superfamily)
VEFNTLTVVNRKNVRPALEVYRFLRDIGSGFIQFIPLVERLPDKEAKQDIAGNAMCDSPATASVRNTVSFASRTARRASTTSAPPTKRFSNMQILS